MGKYDMAIIFALDENRVNSLDLLSIHCAGCYFKIYQCNMFPISLQGPERATPNVLVVVM